MITPTHVSLEERQGSNGSESSATPSSTSSDIPTSSSATTSSSSSSSSDNSDLVVGGIFLGVCGVVLVAICFALWWFCCRRNSCFRRRRREKKYQKLGEGTAYPPAAQGATALQNLDPPVPDNQSQASRKSSDLTRPPPQPRSSGLLTYRVQHIPGYMSQEQVKELFGSIDSGRVAIKSLAPAMGSVEEGLQTATIEFKEILGSFPGRKSTGPTLSREAKALGISVDPRFNGFTPLNTPRNPIRADVVAVTGLAGHAFGSWAHDREHNWLRDYLPKDMPQLRVMTYGYDSQLVAEESSRQELEMHAQDFASRLEGVWEATNYTRPMILIGHSLGCLLIKQALIRSAKFRRHPELLEKVVPLVVFFGAPHDGLETRALETLVKGQPSQEFIQELKPGSVVLEQLSNNFKRISTGIKILTVFERLPTPTAVATSSGEWKREGEPVMMVKQVSACLYWPNETRVSSQTNHKTVAKLERGANGPYEDVKREIASALEAPQRQKSTLSTGKW